MQKKKSIYPLTLVGPGNARKGLKYPGATSEAQPGYR